MTAEENRVVLDASVVVDILFSPSERTAPATAAVRTLLARGATFIGPPVLFGEVRNALLTGIRRQRWDGAAADRAAARLARFPIGIVEYDRGAAKAWELSRRHDNHPIYDMVYVVLARHLEVPLLTQDERLRRRLGGPDWVLSPADLSGPGEDRR